MNSLGTIHQGNALVNNLRLIIYGHLLIQVDAGVPVVRNIQQRAMVNVDIFII